MNKIEIAKKHFKDVIEGFGAKEIIIGISNDTCNKCDSDIELFILRSNHDDYYAVKSDLNHEIDNDGYEKCMIGFIGKDEFDVKQTEIL